MKNLISVVAFAAIAATANAGSAVDLALWTFETSVPTTAGPHVAESGLFAATSDALGFHAGATTYSNPAGNGSVESFSSTNWLVGDYYQFTTSTLGYQSIVLTFDQASSNTGPRDFVVQYSSDGINFTNGLQYQVLANASPNPVWSTGGGRLSEYTTTTSIPVDNAGQLVIRLTNNSTVSANGGTVASGGTSRVDNVQISGVLIPTPGATGLLAVAGVVAARRRRA